MTTAADHTIEEPLNAVLRLRAELRIEPREFGGDTCYVIEDPLRGKFFRLGGPEYTLAALLDGTRSVRAAIRDASGQLRELAFSECEALAICRWLLESGLVETPHAAQHRRLTQSQDCKSPWQKLKNPLCIRVPLVNPHRALDFVEPWLAWTLGKSFFLAWLACCLVALGVAAANWTDLVSGAVVLLAPRHWWLLVISWLALKLLHETYHALVCRKYGGTVSEAGIFLLFFAPVPYVDVTSSWRFASKWQRIATAAAGMYIEILLAAAALIFWANTESDTLRHVAASVAVMASLGTVLVNANPLMRFDGYFILADLLAIPNLNMHGRRWLGSLTARLLGCPVTSLGLPPRPARVVKVYAVAAILWRLMVWLTLTTALLVLLARIHMIAGFLGALAIAVLAIRGALAGMRRWLKGRPAISPKRVCAIAIAGAMAIGVAACLLLGPTTISAPGIVDYRPLVVVRAASPGFIRELHVGDGDFVLAGQKLVVLENRELVVQLRLAEIEIEKSIARCRALRQAGETAREQAERSQQAAVQKTRDELAEQVQGLVIVAPADGQIVDRKLDAWLGRYVETGAELFRIGDEAAKEILLAIDQGDVELFQAHSGSPMRVRARAAGVDPLVATRLLIEPRGTTRPPHEALSSRLAGPLAVLAQYDPDAPDGPPADELLDPCFKATLALSAKQGRLLRAGQLATVELPTGEQSRVRRALAHAQRWFEHQIRDR